MIDTTGLHTELEAASLPVVGVSSDGRVDYSRPLTAAEQTTAKAIIAAHDPAVLTREQQAKAARETAALAVRTANVTALRTGLEAKTGTVAQLQAQVAELAALVEAMRVALGLDEAPEGMG